MWKKLWTHLPKQTECDGIGMFLRGIIIIICKEERWVLKWLEKRGRPKMTWEKQMIEDVEKT